MANSTMDLIKSPTDLYKFMTVGGLVLAISCIIFPVFFYHRTSMEYLAQLRTSSEFQVHEKFTKERLVTIDGRKQQAADERDKLQAQLEELNSGSKTPSNSGEVDKLKSQIEESKRQIKSLEDASHELTLDLELKRQNAKYEETVSTNRRRDSRLSLLICVPVALICSLVALKGVGNWWKWLQMFQVRTVATEAKVELPATIAVNNRVEQAITPQQLEARPPAVKMEAQLQSKNEVSDKSEQATLKRPPR